MDLILSWLINVDRLIFEFVNSTFSHSALDTLAPIYTDFLKFKAAKILVPLFIFFLLFQHHKKASVGIFLGLLVTLGFSDMSASQVYKKTIQRDRPFQQAQYDSTLIVNQRCPAGGYSFPSNHAVNMFAFAGFLMIFLPHWFLFFLFLAALTAWSRVYCGVHFPFDVTAGAVYGFVIGILFSRFTRWSLRFLFPLRIEK